MSRRAKNLQNFTRFIERRLPSRQGNLKVVVLCLIAATTFWFFSALNKEGYTTRVRYPVNITYPSDSNIYLLSELPEDVTVQVTGGGWDLLKKSLRLNTSPIEISLDTPTQTKYILVQSLTEQISSRLDNLTLDQIVTDTLRISIDSTQSRNLSVTVDPESMRLVENYRMVSDIVLSPSQIEVWGPASIIQQLPDTLQLSMDNREISGEIETTLDVPTIDRHVEFFPDEITVNLAAELYTKIERRTPVAPINFPGDSAVYLSQDFVTVSFWLPDVISPALNQLNFEAQADLQTLNQEDSTVAVKLVDIPAIVSDVHFNPSRIPVNYAP